MLSLRRSVPILTAVTMLLVVCLARPARAREKPEAQAREQVAFGIEVARKGLWKEAIYRWQRAVELDPANAAARNNLGVAYEQSGEFDLADEQYKRALELDPDSVHIRQNYELFRESYEKRKRKGEARGGDR